MKNMYLKLGLAACFGLIASFGSFAQDQLNCGYTKAHQRLLQEHPEIAQQEKEADALIRKLFANGHKKGADTVYTDTLTIPIVFHIIHQWGSENITDAQIVNQVEILNRDYQMRNADTSSVVAEFKNVIGNTLLKFVLATKDPDGNCTNGIVRVSSAEANIGGDRAKLNSWDRSHYLNVWVVNKMPEGVAGYAYKPGSVDGPFSKIDGIIILPEYIGSIGQGSAGTSRALTHEVGHYLNLDHTWGGTNDPEVGCGDDAVGDTPETKGHSIGACQTRLKDAVCDVAAFFPFQFNKVTTNSGSTDIDTAKADSAIFINRGGIIVPFKAVGVSANSVSDTAFVFTGWPTGATNGTLSFDTSQTVDVNKYYEISFTPKYANKLTVNGVSLKIHRNATGPRAFAIRTSLNNFASNIDLTQKMPNSSPVDTVGNVLFIKNDTAGVLNVSTIPFGNIINQKTSTVTIRIYGFYGEDANGTFGLDDVLFDGGPALIENVENYMEYAYCSKMFTKGQSARMRETLAAPVAARNVLWKPATLAATGTDGITNVVCSPISDFHNKPIICTNNLTTFNADPSRAFVDTYAWTFQDGVPATSSQANPAVKFTTGGWKMVTLTVTNAQGSDTKTKTKAIYVSDVDNSVSVPYIESFANAGVIGDSWISENPENNQTLFEAVTNTGYYDTQSAKINGFNATGGISLRDGMGDKDYLYTPNFKLAGVDTSYRVSFKLAGATRATTVNNMLDSLVLEYSTNCGQSSWITVKTLKKAELYTAGFVSTDFKPAGKSQWKQIDIPITSSLAKDNIRFRFRYTSATASNNMYIDDFFIGPRTSTNIDEVQLDQSNFSVFPNPVTHESVLKFYLTNEAAVNVQLTDITGKVIGSTPRNMMTEGEQTLALGGLTSNLSSGIYMLMVKVGNQTITHKLIVE